jgi:hypothetical protein
METMKKRTAIFLTSAILVLGFVEMGAGLSYALAQTATPPVNLKTNNGSVALVVDWSPKLIQQGKPVDITISFKDPSSGDLLQHVNYNLDVKDANGGTVKSMMSLHTHTGKDIQSITFDKTGSFQLTITVLGIGITQPFDTSKSGTAETNIAVSA